MVAPAGAEGSVMSRRTTRFGCLAAPVVAAGVSLLAQSSPLAGSRFKTGFDLPVAGPVGPASIDSETHSQDQQQPTFRAQTALVPIDVRVVDRDGKPITDLKASDFTIRENGVPQAIRHFAMHVLTAEAAAPSDGLVRVDPESPLTARNRRVFLLTLVAGRLQHPAMGVEAAIRFLREQVFPQDQVAILAYNRATDFTTNRDALLAVLDRFQARHERIATDLDECARSPACAYLLRDGRLPPYVQRAIDGVFQTPELPGARDLAAGRPAGVTAVARDSQQISEDLQRAAILQQRADDRAGMGVASSPFEDLELALATAATGAMSFSEYAVLANRNLNDLGLLYAGIDYLRYVDGEKHLIYVTQNGMSLPRIESDFSLAAAANDARVAISIVQTGGHGMPVGSREPGEPLTQRFVVSSLRTIAELTGGSASIYSFATRGFDRIAHATSTGYLLGYYPSDGRLDGRYRRVEVQVNRRGAQVMYRHGYFARTPRAPVDLREQMTYARIATAISQVRELRDLPIAMKTSDTTRVDRAFDFVVELTIDPSRVAFVVQGGRHRASLQVAVFCQDAEENPVGDLWQTINLNLTPATFEQLQRHGITHTARVRVTKPVAGVKAVVYDFASDRVGTVVTQVR
jgi:VWFA-related protein